jgi:hypothetical protein
MALEAQTSKAQWRRGEEWSRRSIKNKQVYRRVGVFRMKSSVCSKDSTPA